MGDFTPATVPGCRAPHLWLADGRSLYDTLGPGYTLLRFDPAIDAGPLLDAARERRVPLILRDIDAPDAASLYPRKLVLVRADQHIAWRGDAPPDDAGALLDHLRGAIP